MSGRINITDNYNYDQYKLFDDNIKHDNFNEEAIKGIHVSNKLSNMFFSQQNINILQDAIRYLVNQKSCGKFIIDKQSESELKLIMRAYYLQDGRHRQYNIVDEVKDLNTLVLNYSVPKILQEINMYMYYKKDINKSPMPMARGEFISTKGTRQLVTKEL
jgi:hypothetical protein